MWTSSTRCDSTHCVEWRKASQSVTSNCLEWRKTSHSADTANCLEWRTACHANGSCVEVSPCRCVEVAPVAQVRDSKDPTGPVLSFDASSWRTLTAAIKGGWRG